MVFFERRIPSLRDSNETKILSVGCYVNGFLFLLMQDQFFSMNFPTSKATRVRF